MAAKNPKHLRLNHLAKLPDNVTISNIVQHDNCDEYIVTLNAPEHRSCPRCSSNDILEFLVSRFVMFDSKSQEPTITGHPILDPSESRSL